MNKQIKEKYDKKGYKLIYCPNHPYSKPKNNFLHEHRVVVENFIKRRLKEGECIHHINMLKNDNKIENLMLFKSHKLHSSFHNKVRQFGFTNPIKTQIKNRFKEYK